jgi:hypothetical protein
MASREISMGDSAACKIVRFGFRRKLNSSCPTEANAAASSLKTKAAKKHPKEYKKARERYPSPEY